MKYDIKGPGIYCIENIQTGKKYIGQQVNIRSRWYQHRNELRRGIHCNDYLQKAWNKYGEQNFKFYVLENCSIEELNEKEVEYIEKYNTMDEQFGYNLKSGGQDHSVCSEEVRQKIRDAVTKSYTVPGRREIQRENALRQWSNPEIKAKISGKNNYMYGRHHTAEAKQKMREAKLGVSGWKRNRTPVRCVELDKIFIDATEAAKELHLDSSGILKVCRKERKTCGGYRWEFVNDGK